MSRPGPGAWAARAAALLCALFGVASVARFAGLENLRPGSDGAPVRAFAFDDYALQYYYGRLGSRLLAESGSSAGYDPSFMAGYPKMGLYYPSSKPFELALFAFPGAEPALVFNRTVFALLASTPLLAWGAAALFRLAPAEQLVVVALAGVPHLLVPSAGLANPNARAQAASFYAILEAGGMAAFVFAASLALLVVALLARFLARGGAANALALGAAAPLLLAMHPTAGVLVAVPALVLYASALRRLPRWRHAALWGLGIWSVAANSFWLRGLWLYGHYAALGDFYSAGGEAHFAPPGGLWAPLRVAIPSPWPLSLAPPLGGLAGLALWWREGRRDLLRVFAPQIAFFFALAFYGAPLGLSLLGPARLTLPLCLFLLPPAAHAIAVGARAAWDGCARLGGRRGAWALRAAALALLASGGHSAGLPGKLWRPYALPALQEREGYETLGRGLLDFLREQTDRRGRLLHEETDRLSHRYYGTHLPALIPLETGLALAGGPAPHALLRQNHLRFIAGTFRGRPLGATPPAQMARTLDLYNVRWILCWSAPARRYFERQPGIQPVGTYDRFALYRVEAEPSWFLEGSGRVEARANRIELSELVPEAGRVTLKFHWLETLRSEPARELRPVPRLDDPVPFISILDPPPNLTIYNDS